MYQSLATIFLAVAIIALVYLSVTHEHKHTHPIHDHSHGHLPDITLDQDLTDRVYDLEARLDEAWGVK